MTEDRSEAEQLFRRVLFLFFFDPQSRSGSMSRWVNPVMVKEFRSRRFGRSHWTLRLIAVCAVLSLGLSYVAAAGALDWGVELIGGGPGPPPGAFINPFIPRLPAGPGGAQRESGP